jgi:hypothetical protein
VTRSSGLRLTDVGAARRLPPPPAHSFNPSLASPAGYSASQVWAPPRSLAATKGILSVPRGTEMFQFPRCPLRDRSQSARPCAGRVAPFGHPRISGCQRLPGAFRRVAASFIGRQRQGIHHAPIMRISCATSSPVPVVGSTADRRAPAGRARPATTIGPRPRVRGARWVWCSLSRVCCVLQCARASRHEPVRASPSPAAAEPSGFRVAHCQGASDDTVVARRERLGGRQTSSEGVSRPRTNSPNLVWSVDHGSWSSDHGWRDDENGAGLPGGAAGIRTPDLRRARAALSQLSYGPEPPPRSPGWARLDSNQGPRPYQGRALTA